MTRSLTYQSGVVAFGKMSLMLSGLATAAILSRILSREEYGLYRETWLIYNTVVPLLILGMPESINYFFPQKDASGKKAFNLQSFFLLATGGLLLSAGFYFCAPLMSLWFQSQGLEDLFRAFSLIPLLTLPTSYYQEFFICLGNPSTGAALSAIVAIGRFLAVCTPAWLGYSLRSIFLIFTAFSAIQLLAVSLFLFKPHLRVKAKWSVSTLLEQLKYSIPTGLAFVIGSITVQLDKLIISRFFPPDQFALYANGAFELPLIGIITGSVTAVLMPEAMKLRLAQRNDLLLKLWHRAIVKVALIFLPLMVYLLIVSTEFISLLFSPKYADSSTVFRIFLLTLPTRVATFGTILLIFGLSGTVFRFSAYMLIGNIVLSYLFIKTIGFLGPALGTVVVVYIMSVLQLKRICSELSVGFAGVFPWRLLGRIMLAASMAGVATFGMMQIVPISHYIMVLVYSALVYAFVLGAAYIMMGLVHLGDVRGAIRAVVRPGRA